MMRRGALRRLKRESARGGWERRFRHLKAEALEERMVLSVDLVLTGAGAGGGPHVRLVDAASQEERFSFFAYDPMFSGGVRVALGDVNGDGVRDIITAPGPGAGPYIHVYDGATAGASPRLMQQFPAYSPLFTGGVFVASADVNGDGSDDIITGAGAGGGPHVRIFNGRDGRILQGFFAYQHNFLGGVHVAAADIDADGLADVVTGAGAGGGPHVRVFSGRTNTPLFGFFAYNPLFTGGVHVAAGDVNGDRHADIVTGAGAGGGPHVRVISGANQANLHSFFPYSTAFTGGVRVAVSDMNGDGRGDLITSAGQGMAPEVRVFDSINLSLTHQLNAYHRSFGGGVFVGGGLRLQSQTFPGSTPVPGFPVDLAGERLMIPDVAHWGEKLVALASIRNNGSLASGEFLVEWYLSRDPFGSSDDILLSRPATAASYSHPPVPGNSVGAPFTAMLQLPDVAPPGFTSQNLYIVMRTDAAAQVTESDESNNFGEVGDRRDRERMNITTTPPPNLGFKIDVVITGGLTPFQIAVFQTAADRWSQVIQGDLPDLIGVVDDLQILATGAPIDGPLGVLGFAGPTVVRPSYANLPAQGQMRFDSADLAMLEADGSLLKVILHEMGHVLGIGTLWGVKGLILNSGSADPRFRGALATVEYNRIFGRNEATVPIESFFTAGPGSAEGHWRESTFTNELMTPFIGAGEGTPATQLLSAVTVASLADLGYHVNLANADPFTPDPNASLVAPLTFNRSTPHTSVGNVPLTFQLRASPDTGLQPADFVLPPPRAAVLSSALEEAIVPPSPRALAAALTPKHALAADIVLAEEHDFSEVYAGHDDEASLELPAGLLELELPAGLLSVPSTRSRCYG